MASADNPRLPLTSATAPIVRYTEMRNQTDSPSTTITITTGLNSPSTEVQRTKKHGNSTLNSYELRRMPTQQRRVVKKTLMSNVGYRLARRKELHIERYE